MAFPNYSSLFRSGLLYETPIASSSRTDDSHQTATKSNRRTSLPTSVNARLTIDTSRYSTYNHSPRKLPDSNDYDDAYYFVLKKRNIEPERSFLSLDLADTRSSTSGSTRGRRHSRRSTSASAMTETSYVLSSPLSPLSRSPLLPFALPSPSPPVSPVPRHSPTSTRKIPAPKPMPASTIQYLPVITENNRNRSLSPMRFASPPASPISGGSNLNTSAFPPFPPISPLSRQSSRSFSISGSYRREQRDDALALLEGRKKSAERVLPGAERKNFISLSDDSEDESDYDEVDVDFDDTDNFEVNEDVIDDLDDARNAIIPDISLTSADDSRRSSVLSSTPRASVWNSFSLLDSASAIKLAASQRRSFMDKWFSIDVLNFIDMHDDRDSRSTSSSWPSVVQVTSSA